MEQQQKHENNILAELLPLVLKFGVPALLSLLHKHKDNPIVVNATPIVQTDKPL